MPPLPQIPNQPAGGPSWYSPSGPPASSAGTRGRFVTTASGPVTLPTDWSDEDANSWVAAYDAYIAKQTKAWETASGLQKRQIEAQIEDARKGRENAMKIAKLQDQTSRYGIDQRTASEMRSLKENQRQFDLNHGLNRAKAFTDYASSPDRFVQAGRFLNLTSRVLAGQPGTGGNPNVGTPQAKTMADFDAITGGGGSAGRTVDTGSAAAAGGAGSDKRVAALSAVMKAAPPSNSEGLDGNDFAVLDAAKAIYGMNLTPQQQASLDASPESKAILGSAGANLGYSPEEWWKQQQRSRPGQQSVRQA